MFSGRVSRKKEYAPVGQDDDDDGNAVRGTTSPTGPRRDGPAAEPKQGAETPAVQRLGPFSGPEVSGGGGQGTWPDQRLRRGRPYKMVLVALVVCMVVCGLVKLATEQGIGRGGGGDDDDCPCRPSRVPQYFQTSPQLWAGPTATGRPAFMAQTVAFDPTAATYVPNEPLKVDMPISGQGKDDGGIFRLMGHLSPYSPSPGFGVDEYPLPPDAKIVQVQMLSRHGSRYPTSGSNVASFGKRISSASAELRASGPLSFLNEWKYGLGAEILVPKGRQELFDSGVLHSYMYSKLYNPNSKIIARTTTQDRMLKSAENFMAGFFGLEWTNNVTIEVIIEQDQFNNSLAGYLHCPNSNKFNPGYDASREWQEKYLSDATERFQGMVSGYNWTVEDTYAAQTMCPYETVAFGFSVFCDIFTYEEWQGFEYSIDLSFSGSCGFQSPTGRAVGIGYQQEVMARLRNHTLGYSGSQINTTLDSSTETFPLNQSIYFDFSHDTNIMAVLTAFGFRQFSQVLDPAERAAGAHNLTVSHLTPFGARLDMEIIQASRPVSADRSGRDDDDDDDDNGGGGGPTKYVHFMLNQRTLPLGVSFPDCGDRVDGWCELETFMRVQDEMAGLAQYDYACFGKYDPGGYGDVSDGAPPKPHDRM